MSKEKPKSIFSKILIGVLTSVIVGIIMLFVNTFIKPDIDDLAAECTLCEYEKIENENTETIFWTATRNEISKSTMYAYEIAYFKSPKSQKEVVVGMLYGGGDNHIILVEKIGGNWNMLSHDKRQFEDERDDAEKGIAFFEHEGKNYLYYTRKGFNSNGHPYLIFNIASLNSEEQDYVVTVGGNIICKGEENDWYDTPIPDCKMKGEPAFRHIKALQENKIFLEYLSKKIEQSPSLYKYGKKDYNYSLIENHLEKWKIDAPKSIREFISYNNDFTEGAPEKFSFHRYNVNKKEIGISKDDKKINLENFIVYDMGSVFVYDKKQRNYYSIWAFDCESSNPTGAPFVCSFEVNKISQNKIYIAYCSRQYYFVFDLEKSELKVVQKNKRALENSCWDNDNPDYRYCYTGLM